MEKRIQLIVIEGPDLSGKSTLAHALSKKIPGILIKITDRPKDGSYGERKKISDHYYNVREILDVYQKPTYLLDRYIWSEMAYSYKREYEAIDDFELLDIEQGLLEIPHLFILCDPSLSIMEERFTKRKDDYVDKKDLNFLVARYHKIYERSPLNKMRLNTVMPVEKLVKLVQAKLKTSEKKK